MIGLLRRRAFALVWWAALTSRIGNWVLVVALHVYLYEQTGSPLAVSGVFVAYYLPALLFGSLAGVFADRWDRRRTMVASNLGQAAAVLLLLFIRSDDVLWLAYAVAFLDAALAQLFQPASSALMPRLVPSHLLAPANALDSTNDHLARSIGPAVAGVVVGVAALHGAALVDSASFLVSAILIALVRPEDIAADGGASVVSSASHPAAGFRSELGEGLRLIGRSQTLLGLLIVGSIGSLAWSFFQTLLVPFVIDVIGSGPESVGAALGTRGVAGLLGGVVVGYLTAFVPLRRLLALSLGVCGSAFLLQVSYPTLAVLFAAMALIGPAFVAWGTSQRTLMQTLAPDTHRGRVFGAYSNANAVVLLLGNTSAGAMAEVVGVVPVLVGSAALFLVAAAVALFMLRTRETARQ